MNQNYSNTGGRSGAKKRSDERVTTGNTGQNFLSNFIYGKEGQRKGKLNPFGINLPDFGITEAISGTGQQVADVFKRKETADPNQTQLPNQAFDENKFYRNLRGMQVTDSILRDYEMGREKQRQLDMFRQTMPLVDIAAETAAQRRLMEDRSSPTKISQQILRARQGEAALMNALANQTSSAAAASAQGIAPRGRAGGR
jgi:hypothetical protein|tara:strand:- start:16 stop:612 length:597 start_codon:yes stop_codon:yes gene_type:complete